jgi:hypothetical protein
MTGEGKYQGWTNWETWHTALLIDNEYDIYQKKIELVKKKASLEEFKRRLKIAEDKTKMITREDPENWGKTFGKVNWQEIYDKTMTEEYS